MIHDVKAYPTYKDSGVPWLGEVPGHWEVVPIGRMGRFLRAKGGTKADDVLEGVPCIRYGDLYTRHEFFIRASRSFVTKERSGDYTAVHYGDVLFAGSGETIEEIGKSAVCLLESKACCGGDVLLFRPTRDIVPQFLGYAADSPSSVHQKACMGRGVTVMHIYAERLKHLQLAIPPLPEQSAIVRFLAHADRRIRRYIRAKTKLIALLNEQKQAIIHCAVTRGLDPNVRLKPSGVEWLGEVPEHWEVSQLRRLVRRGRRITYGIVQPGEPDPSGRFMVRGQDYSFGWAKPETIFRVSAKIEIPYKRSRLSTGDLVLTIVGAGVGNVDIVPAWLDGANITQTTARVSVDPTTADAEFIAAVLQGPVGRRNVELYVKGAAQPGLNLEHVRVFLVPVPPVDEQRRIIAVVRSETGPLHIAADRAHREVSLLREFCTRLIFEVVTGKLDVREAVARLPEEPEEPEPLDEEEAAEAVEGTEHDLGTVEGAAP